MIYLDNAATSAFKPKGVFEALNYDLSHSANSGRSGHRYALDAAMKIEDCRRFFLSAMNAPEEEYCVAFTKNCTEALNLGIFGFLRAGMRVVTTAYDHNSVLRPLFELEKRKKIELMVIRPDESGRILPSHLDSALQNADFCAVSLASNVTGSAIDPAAVRALLPARVLTVCDGAQACGHTAVQMRADGIDLLAAAGHKGLHGIQGSGALLLSARAELFPYAYGGTGTDSADPDMPPFYPERLEAGTLSCPAAASLAEGALYLLPRRAAVAARLHKMTGALLEGLRAVPGIRVYSEANVCGIAAFGCEALSSELFAQRLSDEYGIAVRGGLHCAPRMHAALGTLRTGLVRASLSEFNTEGEISDFLRAVRAIAASP